MNQVRIYLSSILGVVLKVEQHVSASLCTHSDLKLSRLGLHLIITLIVHLPNASSSHLLKYLFCWYKSSIYLYMQFVMLHPTLLTKASRLIRKEILPSLQSQIEQLFDLGWWDEHSQAMKMTLHLVLCPNWLSARTPLRLQMSVTGKALT